MRPGIDYIGITTPFYCTDGKGNFLFHKRSNNCRDERGKWDCGSGQLEFGETPEESVLREVVEEYGVKGKIQEQLPAYSLLRTHNGIKTHWVVIPFIIKADIRKAKMMEPEKATEIGIFTLDRLPKPLHTGARMDMSRYKEYFERYKNYQRRKR